jgi:hypothetical protein
MEGIYEVAIRMALGSKIYIPSVMTTGSGIQVILKYYLNNARGCSIGIIDERDLRIMPLRWP